MLTKYKTATEATHLKSPKVTRFMGSIKMLITGLAINEATVNPRPVKRSVSIPF